MLPCVQRPHYKGVLVEKELKWSGTPTTSAVRMGIKQVKPGHMFCPLNFILPLHTSPLDSTMLYLVPR